MPKRTSNQPKTARKRGVSSKKQASRTASRPGIRGPKKEATKERILHVALELFRELLGAEVPPVASGTRTLKDATNEAIRDWVTH